MRAYVLIQVEVGTSAVAARAIQRIDGIRSVEQVTGPYDVVAQVEARNLDDLSTGVIANLHAIDGVIRTLTCAAPGR